MVVSSNLLGKGKKKKWGEKKKKKKKEWRDFYEKRISNAFSVMLWCKD
tara:strand:- start:4 stop:147 length:144 start_codon:yes stop_codon:yes gene_type:complete